MTHVISSFRILAVLLVLLASATAFAEPHDRTPPTTPTKLRVTGVSPTSVSFAWNPSSDNSGSFFYVLLSGITAVANASMADTTYTLTGLNPGTTYTFRLRARDQAMNWSGYSNTVSATTLAANTPPSPPVLSAPSVGPTHISLSWTAPPDAAPSVRYWIYQDGVQILASYQTTSLTLYLNPGTTHTYTVQVRSDGLFSAQSNAVKVTTPATDPNDHTPPTAPTNLSEGDWGDAEFELSWTESTDNVTAQDFIRYEVYVNGELSDVQIGTGAHSINYGTFGALNTVEVVAIDEAGNQSAPAVLTFFLD